jgi:hypothetical protein
MMTTWRGPNCENKDIAPDCPKKMLSLLEVYAERFHATNDSAGFIERCAPYSPNAVEPETRLPEVAPDGDYSA